jgi:deoxyribodipyrimidine photo-lyase
MLFSTNYQEILAKIDAIDPVSYGQTRNYLNGAVTRLSPYISRGVISTRQVAQHVLSKGYKPEEIESFLKELAWRDYFQRVWIARGDEIDRDLKWPQPKCTNTGLSHALAEASTGIAAIDSGINDLKQKGYIHNHMRMYIASLACNIAGSHWKAPAQWMYYYLLDADWASNALSWQWVAGSFSSKKYVANQENINRYCNSTQRDTFLDVPYESFAALEPPEALGHMAELSLETKLPDVRDLKINEAIPTYIYNFYNLDCSWQDTVDANRILLLEPSFFKRYPVCSRTVDFLLALADNIKNIQVYVGEFAELLSHLGDSTINYKEHPTTAHYRGEEHPREWMFESVSGYYPSFFAYWKKGRKQTDLVALSRLHAG